MTTLPIRANALPQVALFPIFGRIAAAVSLFLDAYAEALQQTHEARKKYPFADV